MEQSNRARVLLADDHAIVAESLAQLLSREHELVGVVHNGTDLVASAVRLRPEIIVSDMEMPRMSGLEALKRFKAERISAKVIVLTMHDDAALASEALKAGAAGYLLKSSAGDELFTAIREVRAGGVYLTPRIARKAIAAMRDSGSTPLARLTDRQREVLRLVVSGRTMKEVASDLSLSPRTVESHKYEVMHLLGVQTTVELVRYAMQHGV